MPLTLEEIDRLIENPYLADYFEEVIVEYKKLVPIEAKKSLRVS